MLTRTPELRSPAVRQYEHETGARDVGWKKASDRPETAATATEQPDTETAAEAAPAVVGSEMDTAAAAVLAPVAGHEGEGIVVGAGSGVAEGTQPKPLQPPAGHVWAVAPCACRGGHATAAAAAVWHRGARQQSLLEGAEGFPAASPLTCPLR